MGNKGMQLVGNLNSDTELKSWHEEHSVLCDTAKTELMKFIDRASEIAKEAREKEEFYDKQRDDSWGKLETILKSRGIDKGDCPHFEINTDTGDVFAWECDAAEDELSEDDIPAPIKRLIEAAKQAGGKVVVEKITKEEADELDKAMKERSTTLQ